MILSNQKKINHYCRENIMNIYFLPVPAEDWEKGRNYNCYAAGQPLTEAMQEQFMDEIKPICIKMERLYGVPAAFLGGQAVNESGFGLTRTGYYANNLCGLKFVKVWYRQPPQIMDGSDFGVETYQLVGQPDETDERSVKIVQDLAESEEEDEQYRKVFDEASRYDNRYFKFPSKHDFFDFLCQVAYLNGSNGQLYPLNLRSIFDEYQSSLSQNNNVRDACIQVAWKLGEAGYCHQGADYYSRVIANAMDNWNTYEWTEEARRQLG
jgi:hypothetical protein